MATHEMKRQTIPLSDGWDVIVVGGGPSGCAAAAASAEQGARTLLLEATGGLGGMGTLGLVPWFGGYHDREKVVARGIAERIRLGLHEGMPFVKKAHESVPKNAADSPAIAPELLKRLYDDLVTQAGVHVLFQTQFASVEMADDNTVDALIAANKRGFCAFRGTVYVDATGDGDLATWAGAEFEKGDETGALQPATECFMIANVDEDRLAQGPNVHFFDPESPIWKILEDDKYPDIIELHSCLRKIGPGVFGFNTGHVFDVDNTDPENVSQSLAHGRKMAGQYRDALAEYHPAFADSFLAGTGTLLGVRETRRVIGDAYLVVDDYLAARSFPDEICRNAYGIDVHCSKKRCLELATRTVEELKKFNRNVTRHLPPGGSFGVPYRCLTPKGLRNVLVSGRCISADRQVNGSIRVMACCLNTGEAAGVAAAIAASDSADSHAVNTEALRETLRERGAYLP